MIARLRILPLLASLGLLVGCSSSKAPESPPIPAGPAPAPWFEEMAAARGLAFQHHSGASGHPLMPECITGGAALFDADGDGDLDAYLVQGGRADAGPDQRPGNALFLNDGAGHFTNATAGSGAEGRGYGMGVTAGDMDDDGITDLYVTTLDRHLLLRGLGGGRFEDVTERAGVATPGWGTSAAFFDYDRDGDLDLFVARYLAWSPGTEIDCRDRAGGPDYCQPNNYRAPTPDVLYRNDGGGRFTDVSRESGIAGVVGTGLGVACADFDGNGFDDLYVANDGMPNRLWLNDGKGHFVEAGMVRGCALDDGGRAKAGMGVDAGDVDGDGDVDIVVGNLNGETDSLFLDGDRAFAEASLSAGLAVVPQKSTRFGLGLEDFDQDGCLDLFEANGRVTHHAPEHDATDRYAEPNAVFRGQPGPRFEEVLPQGGTANLLIGTARAAALGDVDGDGAVDVLVVDRDGPARLLLNIVPNRGHWLLIRCVERHGRDALGAVVTATVGTRRLTGLATATGSFQASSDPRVHLGLGAETLVRDIHVRWPDGTSEGFGDLAADRVAVLREGQGMR